MSPREQGKVRTPKASQVTRPRGSSWSVREGQPSRKTKDLQARAHYCPLQGAFCWGGNQPLGNLQENPGPKKERDLPPRSVSCSPLPLRLCKCCSHGRKWPP